MGISANNCGSSVPTRTVCAPVLFSARCWGRLRSDHQYELVVGLGYFRPNRARLSSATSRPRCWSCSTPAGAPASAIATSILPLICPTSSSWRRRPVCGPCRRCCASGSRWSKPGVHLGREAGHRGRAPAAGGDPVERTGRRSDRGHRRGVAVRDPRLRLGRRVVVSAVRARHVVPQGGAPPHRGRRVEGCRHAEDGRRAAGRTDFY